MTTDTLSNPLALATGADARRDLRVDLVRGLALLIIFSDHVRGNPVRDFMPIILGFSDMGEVFIFLSGYVNGIRRPTADSSRGTSRQLSKTLTRCLQLYGVILLMHALTVVMLAGSNACEIQSVSITDLVLPRSHIEPDFWKTLTLQCLLINSCVLALYLILIWIVPFVAASLHRHQVATVVTSVALYTSVQIWPRTLSLPAPWSEAFFFNPLAWQLPFVLGMAYGAGRSEPACRAFIPRNRPALVAAVCGLEIAFLIRAGWWDPPVDISALSVTKPTLGPLRLVHFYCVLIVGRALFSANGRFLKTAFLHPIILCGQHPLVTYCTGGLLATLGTLLLTKYGSSLAWAFGINVAGWLASMLAASFVRLFRRRQSMER